MGNYAAKENQLHAPLASGVTVVAGDILGLNSSGEAVLARATAPIVEAIGFAIVADTYGGCEVTSQYRIIEIDLLLEGRLREMTEGDGTVVTPGLACYIDPANPGKITQTRPTTSGQLRQVLGVGYTASRISIRVGDPDYIA